MIPGPPGIPFLNQNLRSRCREPLWVPALLPQPGGSLLGGDLRRDLLTIPDPGPHSGPLPACRLRQPLPHSAPSTSCPAPAPSALLLQRPPGPFPAGGWLRPDPQPWSGCCAPASLQLCLQDLCSPRQPPPPKASSHPCGPPPPKASPRPSLAHPSSASLGSGQRGPSKAGPEPLGVPRLVGGAGPGAWATHRSPEMASWGGEAVAPRELPEVGRLAWTFPTHCLLLDVKLRPGCPPTWELTHPGFLPAWLLGPRALLDLPAPGTSCGPPHQIQPSPPAPELLGAGPGLPCPCAPSVQTPSAEQAPRTSLTRWALPVSLGGGSRCGCGTLTLPRESPTWLPREATPCPSEWPLVAPPGAWLPACPCEPLPPCPKFGLSGLPGQCPPEPVARGV